MYTTSDRFHEAIREDELQIPWFTFADAIVTSQHIDISNGGIAYSANANSKDDFTPGTCCSATLDFTIFNEDGRWTNYEFGKFTAKLGVRTASETYTVETENCRAIYNSANYFEGYSVVPFLRLNGSNVSGSSVSFPVMAIHIDGNTIYAIGEDGTYETYTYNGSTLTKTDSPLADEPFIPTAEQWAEQGMGISYRVNYGTAPDQNNNLIVCRNGQIDSYELVPLGVFIADRPVYSSNETLTVQSYDQMTLLDKTYEKLTYSTTLYNLVSQICDKCGVELGSESFVNGTVTLKSAPSDFKTATYRDILQWVAEIAGSFAMFGRDGKLYIKWYSTADITLDESDYSSMEVAYYEAAPVTQVIIRDSDWDDDKTSGTSGNNIYIQNNPIADAIS